MENQEFNFSEEEWEACIKVLKNLTDDPFHNPDNKTFGALITKISKRVKKLSRNPVKHDGKSDAELLRQTIISKNALSNHSDYGSKNYKEAEYKELSKNKNCYCCNQAFNKLHFFYNRLCPNCAEYNYEKRFEEIDLRNKNVIITGGRVKIGYATALKFLRNKANIIVTTRFPNVAYQQFSKEKDFDEWKAQLTIYGLDLRDLKSVNHFIDFCKQSISSLDILVNNAAQTIKYNDEYYVPVLETEDKLRLEYKNNPALIIDTEKSSKLISFSPENTKVELNRFNQPVDLREKNSWNSKLTEISTYELLEVNLINQISPYLLIKELTALFHQSTSEKKFIINVTSSEGQFSYENKTVFHPHTNMTKAGLNMLTRTAAADYAKDNVFMTAVDVGWISTGAIEPLRKKQFERGYIPPLDSVDGACRIFHPIIESLKNNNDIYGVLLKNYKKVSW